MPLRREVGLGPSDIVLMGTQLPLKRGHSPQFSAHVYCGQTAGWIKMPLGTKVGLGPGHIVLHGDPAPPKGAQLPTFRPMSMVAKRSPISTTAEHLFQFRLSPNIIYGAVLPLPFISPYASLPACSKQFVNVQRL